jgi:flavin reductase (DIM6/NTAB) family NADH-FMN oxidoreductase RutF/rubredoxin
MINIEALFKISYGIYIISSGDNNKGNGFVSNTVVQVASDPAKLSVCSNKNNFTAELIQKHGAFSISILSQESAPETFGKFGYKSGKDFDKMVGSKIKYGATGVPIVLDDAIAYLECKLLQTIDVGSHLLFIGELLNSDEKEKKKEPITYAYYRQVKKGVSPKNAPTYHKPEIEKPKLEETTKKYKCVVCSYVYDEATEKIKFTELPYNWICPLCSSEKHVFGETP